MISESHLKFNSKLQIPNFTSYSRNRKEISHGGIATVVLDSEANDCLKVSDGVNDNDFLVTRHSQFSTPLNVINVYSQQETRTAVSVIRENWNEVIEEIIRIETRKEHLILIGDFNKHIGDGIQGNHNKISEGGKLIRELLKNDKYILLN